MKDRIPSILVFSGGVGGAKFVDGLNQVLPPGKLSVCVNTGDDFEAFGLSISPDLDSVCYALAGIANPETGWGLSDDTWNVIEAIGNLGGPTWFSLGDKDLATHLERTRLLRLGLPLTKITTIFCNTWGIQANVLPMSDQPVQTRVDTVEFGLISFQEYFVERRCEPKVMGFIFSGADIAKPATGLLECITEADAILFGPSNPLVSIDPILSISSIRKALVNKTVIAISPIVGGKAIKGPLAKMFSELGIEPDAKAIAAHYRGLISGYILDNEDQNQAEEINQWDIITLVTDTVMKSRKDRSRLADEVLGFISKEFTE
jgi:LPPG:FO 2-phospho-L-lactate transferase